jgi:hypothetical protein
MSPLRSLAEHKEHFSKAICDWEASALVGSGSLFRTGRQGRNTPAFTALALRISYVFIRVFHIFTFFQHIQEWRQILKQWQNLSTPKSATAIRWSWCTKQNCGRHRFFRRPTGGSNVAPRLLKRIKCYSAVPSLSFLRLYTCRRHWLPAKICKE